jgi:hypothetical protein
MGGAMVLYILHGVATSVIWRGRGATTDGILDLATWLTPFGHRDGFFYPAGGALVTDLALCLALTVIYFAAGFSVLRRRDL